MRVAKYYNNQDVRIEEMSEPDIGRGELLVKVLACGLCGSDVMEWYRIKKAPLVLGHEACGEIVEVGAEVSGFKKGDRVFVSHHVPCNKCRYCLAGHHTACDTLHKTNFYPGGFAEYLKVPAINVDRGTFKLPSEVSFQEGTFIEPLACVVRGQRVAGFKPGHAVFVLGSGISGLLHIMLAKACGASRIIATDVDPFRLKKAKEFGADVILPAKGLKSGQLIEAGQGRGADLVIVCTSAKQAFIQAFETVDKGGTVLCFAPAEPGVEIPLPINEFWRKSIKVIPSYGGSPQDIVLAIGLIRRKIVSVSKMITHCLSLDETGLGFRMVAQSQNSLKVIIEPHKQN